MTERIEQSWPEANRRHLLAALEVVAARLRAYAQGRGTSAGPSSDASAPASTREAHEEAAEAEHRLAQLEDAMERPPPLATLVAAFGLSPFEREVVLLCAGVELDGGFAELVARMPGAEGRLPTFSLALAASSDATWSALVPDGPLRRFGLVDLEPGEILVRRGLRVAERVLHHLVGLSSRDERLAGLVRPLVGLSAVPSQAKRAWRVSELWSGFVPGAPVVVICGSDPGGRRALAAVAAVGAGLEPFVLEASDVPVAAVEREALARLWEREVLLEGAALLVELDDGAGPAERRAALALVERLYVPVAVSAREPLAPRHRPVVRVDAERPLPKEQLALWREALGAGAAAANGALEAVTHQFDLTVESILAASGEALAGGPQEGDDTGLGERLWAACRSQSRPRLGELATWIDARATWDDLVVPDGQRRVLGEIAAQVRQRHTVYESWGFRDRCSRGLGIGALFTGGSGTGKTMAAEVLANELALDLYRIDLSAVVSKYIGETEKNLRRVFDAAEDGGAILLFDEADALFGKRSEVKDSHDRYANIEVSYLLQRMEAYRGLAILTTNMKDALDGAFLRRLRFVVPFPFPDAAQRAEIWRRVFPSSTPTSGLDADVLAGLNVAGGNIRNIALYAAFLAADSGGPVVMEHVVRAARVEYAKLDRPLTDAELRGAR